MARWGTSLRALIRHVRSVSSASVSSLPTVDSLQRSAAFRTHSALVQSPRSEHFPFRPIVVRERELDLRRLLPRGRPRLDHRLVHARTTRSSSERRIHGRTLLHLQRGARPLPSDEAAGWEVPRSPYRCLVLHHANKAGWRPPLAAQAAYARRQYFPEALLTAPPTGCDGWTRSRLLAAFGARPRRPRTRSRVRPRRPGDARRPPRPPPFGAPPQVALPRQPPVSCKRGGPAASSNTRGDLASRHIFSPWRFTWPAPVSAQLRG